MDKKVLNIFIFVLVFLIITIFAVSFIKIEKYENCLLYNNEEQSKIIMNKKVYNDIKKYKSVFFLINKNSYNKKIIKFEKQNENYVCIIEKIVEYKNSIANINLKTKNKSIFDL